MGLFEHFPYVNFHNLNLDWILQKIKELLTRMTAAEEKLEEHEERLDAAEATLQDHEERLTAAEADIDDLQDRMTAAEGDIDDLQTRMTAAEGDIDDLQTRMTAAEGAIDALEDLQDWTDVSDAFKAAAVSKATIANGTKVKYRNGRISGTLLYMSGTTTTAQYAEIDVPAAYKPMIGTVQPDVIIMEAPTPINDWAIYSVDCATSTTTGFRIKGRSSGADPDMHALILDYQVSVLS